MSGAGREKDSTTARPDGIVAPKVADTKTGAWRSERPVVDAGKCVGCGVCSMYCPTGSIRKGKPAEIDYEYCKGCGICPSVCPVHAIAMEREGKYDDSTRA
mgnify:CR=1 FL=1|jgi:pyruvate ferredoxin oxidoreductase delta subunit